MDRPTLVPGDALTEAVPQTPGDFGLIPKGLVHREGNAGDDPNEGVLLRVGTGPVTVNLDGPEE
jgi:uncharacterized RmlC-like cupin family protein